MVYMNQEDAMNPDEFVKGYLITISIFLFILIIVLIFLPNSNNKKPKCSIMKIEALSENNTTTYININTCTDDGSTFYFKGN